MKKIFLLFFAFIAFAGNAQLMDKSKLDTDESGEYYTPEFDHLLSFGDLIAIGGSSYVDEEFLKRKNYFADHDFYFDSSVLVQNDTLIHFERGFQLQPKKENNIYGNDKIDLYVSDGKYSKLIFITHNKSEFEYLLNDALDNYSKFRRYFINPYGIEYYYSAQESDTDLSKYTGPDTIAGKVVIPQYVIVLELKPTMLQCSELMRIFEENNLQFALDLLKNCGYKLDKETTSPDNKTVLYAYKSLKMKNDYYWGIAYPYGVTICWDKVNSKILFVDYYTYSEEEEAIIMKNYEKYGFTETSEKDEKEYTVYTYESKDYPNFLLKEWRNSVKGADYTSHTYRFGPR